MNDSYGRLDSLFAAHYEQEERNKRTRSAVRNPLAFLLLLAFFGLPFTGQSQSFEVATDVCDSISPTSYSMHVSGYATFSDSITMTIELLTLDSIPTVVYTGSKDFATNGVSTLTNFTYDPTSEAFSLDIGTYATRLYNIRVRSWVNGLIKEELTLDTY